MAFWGVEVKPGKPYILKQEDVDGKLILTQAALGFGSSTKKCTLRCNVGDKSPVNLCTLLPDKIESCSLTLEFMEEEDVKFSVVGPTSIHLSGFIQVDDSGCGHDHGYSDSDGEDIGSESDVSMDNDSEEDSDDYDSDENTEDGFIVDDGYLLDSPVRKSGVVIEEIVDEEDPKSENAKQKQSRSKKQSGKSTQDGNSQELVAKGTSVPVLESEDEDGFPLSTKKKADGENKSEVDSVKPSKRKKDGAEVDGQATEASPDAKQNGDEFTLEENPKNKKKKMKKEQATSTKADETADAKTIDSSKTVVEGMPSEEKQKKKKNKKKKKGDNEEGKPVENGANVTVAIKKNVSAVKEEKKTVAKPAKPRTYSNGMVVEVLEMGKADGKKATAGKKVAVRYIGRTKKDNKIFDSNLKGKPFKFILGVGQVIKGWDVGVEGMHIGDKRRLTIPPPMGYGARGAPPAIPPNAWLVFDVELVDC